MDGPDAQAPPDFAAEHAAAPDATATATAAGKAGHDVPPAPTPMDASPAPRSVTATPLPAPAPTDASPAPRSVPAADAPASEPSYLHQLTKRKTKKATAAAAAAARRTASSPATTSSGSGHSAENASTSASALVLPQTHTAAETAASPESRDGSAEHVALKIAPAASRPEKVLATAANVVIVPSFSTEALKLRKPGERKPFHQKLFKTPKETAVALEAISIYKTDMRLDRLIILGFVAGIFVAFGSLFAISVVGGMGTSPPGLQKLMFGLCFEVALIFIVLFGADLFTGNTMTLTIGLLLRSVSWRSSLKVLVVSYFSNFAGAAFGVIFFGYFTEIFAASPWVDYTVHIVAVKCAYPLQVVFLKGIACNMLVCLGVWMALAAESVEGKILACVVPITAFATIGFEHCIANMSYAPLGFLYSDSSGLQTGCNFGIFVYHNLILVTLGNMIGGSLLGLAIWWVFLEGRRTPTPKDID